MPSFQNRNSLSHNDLRVKRKEKKKKEKKSEIDEKQACFSTVVCYNTFMTERNNTPTTSTMRQIASVILTALRLAPRFANEDGELLVATLIRKFPAVRHDAIDLVASRVSAAATSGKFDEWTQNALASQLHSEVENLPALKPYFPWPSTLSPKMQEKAK